MQIGESFPEELAKAGLSGLPFAWTPDGELTFSPDITKKQQAAILAVFKAHDPSKPSILKQIGVLEAQQTPRRVRDAYDGTDNGWMKSLESQLAALRAQL